VTFDGAGVLESGAAAGLVYIGTSQTGSPAKQVERVKTISDDEQKARRLGKMKRNVITSARLHVEDARRGGFRGRWAMLTLTYRDSERWVANQVAAFLDCLRKYCTRAGFEARYTWVLELTQRGRPHYHVLVWLPKGRTLPKPDKQGWWKFGLTRIEWARNAVGYLAKYASKGIDDFRLLPKGARLSGFGGLSKPSRIERRWWMLPGWLREIWNEICDVTRPPKGGGYVRRDTGEFLASPWAVYFHGGVLVLGRVL